MHTYVQGQLEQILSIVLDADSPHTWGMGTTQADKTSFCCRKPTATFEQWKPTVFVDDYAGLYYLLANMSIGDYHSP